MCGRYAFDDTKDIYEARKILEEIASRLGSGAGSVKTGEVFPSEQAAIVAQTSATEFRPDVMRWGYPVSGANRLVINARSETLLGTNMFRKSVLQKKCLIPCTGFYEWKSEGGAKQKFIIRPKDERFFYLAGLYDSFEQFSDNKNRFVIVTAPANEAMKEIHNRMPLIVPAGHARRWLFEFVSDESIKKLYGATKLLDIIPA